MPKQASGGWAGWSDWSGWGKSLCQGNARVKTRACANPVPSSNDASAYCDGESSIKQPGPINGGFSEWTQWSSCERPCGGNLVNRSRVCNSPPPSQGGRQCSGSAFETKLECVMPCPENRTDGEWSPWGGWSLCPVHCQRQGGGAWVYRRRVCDSPPPMYGGRACPGNETERVLACYDSCPVHGGYGQWSSFTACSKTCGSGVMHRQRYCNNPQPRGEGSRNCTGKAFHETRHCRLATCLGAVDGGWAAWSQWSTCSEQTYCLKGTSQRSRTCTNPAPNQGGDDCPGADVEKQQCPRTNCKTPPRQIPATLPVGRTEYLYKECNATVKYAQQNFNVPSGVLAHIKRARNKFEQGYYATKTEEDGTVVKYCFEPWPLLTLREAGEIVPSYTRTTELPNYKKPADDSLPVLGFSMRAEASSHKLRGWDFGINEVDAYTAGNKLTLNNVMFTYYSDGTFWSFLAKGELRLFRPAVFDCVIFRNRTGEVVTSLIGKAKKMKLGDLSGALRLPDDTHSAMDPVAYALKKIGVWNLEFVNLEVAYDFKHQFLAPFRITATRDFGGVPLHFELIYIHSSWDRKLAIAFQFDGASYGAVLEKMAGSSSAGKAVTSFLNTLGLQVEIGVAYCPETYGGFKVTKTTRYGKQPLRDAFKTEVPPGLAVVAKLGFPKDCRGSSFCKICKKILGSKANFRMMANVKSGSLKASAGFYDVKIYENYKFTKVELFVEVNTTSDKRTVGFKMEVQIPVKGGKIIVDGMEMEQSLRLGGEVKHKMGTNDVSGKLYMKGMWMHAFGLSWLNIGNIMIGLSITIGSPIPVTGFQFGGQLEFGHNCIYDADFAENGHCLRLQIYFGYGKPSYFFGQISSLTIGKIVRMAGGGDGMPRIIYNSGFPDGLMVSYNPSGDDIDLRSIGGPIVKNGFRLKGTLNFLGYKIKAHIKYSPREIYIDGELSPINLGGVLVMSRNETHTNVGPKFQFMFKRSSSSFTIKKKDATKKKISMLPFWKVYFEGYVNLFGIKRSAYLNITTTQLEMFIYGKVLNLVYAELFVASNYDYMHAKDMNFYVRVIVDLRKLTDAIEAARKAVDAAFKYAQKQLRSAQESVKAAKRRCKEMMNLQCSRCKNLKCREASDKCKNFMNAAGKWIGNAAKKVGSFIVNTAKKIFSSWGKRRRRRALLSRRNRHFDVHIRNKRFINKVICEGVVGVGCSVVSHLCEGSCNIAQFMAKGLCSVLDVAVGVLKLTETAMGWVNSALQFLMQMFLVHGIRFELGLGHKFNGFMVGAAIDLTIFGSRQYFEFQFDLKNPVRSILSAKDGGLYRYKQGVRQVRTAPTFNPYDRPNPFADFDITGTFGIESLATSSFNRLGACIATTKLANELKLVACNHSDAAQKWTHTLMGKLINLKTRKCLSLPNANGGVLRQVNCESRDQHQFHHACDSTIKTVKRRKTDLCISTAPANGNGPGSLQHHGSLKCVHVSPSNRLVLKSLCHVKSSEFEIDSSGYLVHHSKSLCARATSNKAVNGATLEMVAVGAQCHKFAFTRQGSLQHIASRLCVQTAQRKMVPADYEQLVLGTACEYVSSHNRATGDLPDPQMTFTFVPLDNKLYMSECGEFYNQKTEQRFAIAEEQLSSVCSKYSADLALNKIASQSSTKYNGFASRAIDGNFNFQWEQGSCMLTQEQQDPWWRVDLGKEFMVTDVTIVARGDTGDKLRDFQVHVGNHLVVRRNPVCFDRVGSVGAAQAARLQCELPLPGQFVGVQVYAKASLSMCEVVVSTRFDGFSDMCQVENGGCDQVCTNECGSNYVRCSCRPGFLLAYDKKTCIDIDECKSNNGGCRSDYHAFCRNTPGSFYCQCQPGYILKDNSQHMCQDFNECGVKNGGCEQMCNNKQGGRLCTCRQGYERRKDSDYGCQNVNECLKENGGCEHECTDTDGSYYCSCKPGFNLMLDRKSCEEVYCGMLEQYQWTSVSPSLQCLGKSDERRPVNSQCTFDCARGYTLKSGANSTTIQCKIDGTWNKPTPACHPQKCPLLPRPTNGGLVPPRCHTAGGSEYGQRCVAYCRQGFRLRGPPTKYCLAGNQWSSQGYPVECIKVEEPPYLNCPVDMTLELSSGSNTAQLLTRFEPPQTNVEKLTAQPNINSTYAFPAGQTLVSYRSDDLECSYYVTVKDVTKPRVEYCPDDIIITSSSASQVIVWREAKFSDNVGVTQVRSPYRESGSRWNSGETMRLHYVASDAAGNHQTCSFTVSLKSSYCPVVESKNDTIVRAFVARQRYYVSCANQKALFGSYGYSGAMMVCKQGEYWLNADKIGLRIPHCVPYKRSTVNGVCDQGSQKFEFDDWLEIMHYCSECPPGMYEQQNKCVPCAIGSYQDETGQSECEVCPRGYSTKAVGSNDEKDCIKKCAPGSYSPSGVADVPCKLCPSGTYADEGGLTSCLRCANNFTSDPGANSSSLCRQPLVITRISPGLKAVARVGNYITLTCFYTGHPPGEVTWSKQAGLLPSSSQVDEVYDMDLNVIGSQLLLSNVQFTDHATYTCSVRNRYYTTTKSIPLYVTSLLKKK